MFSSQLQQTEISATRSGNLAQELYIENSKLTKALQQTEANEKRAEKANRQLTEQKKALQRVISKLCGANAIAWKQVAVFFVTSWEITSRTCMDSMNCQQPFWSLLRRPSLYLIRLIRKDIAHVMTSSEPIPETHSYPFIGCVLCEPL